MSNQPLVLADRSNGVAEHSDILAIAFDPSVHPVEIFRIDESTVPRSDLPLRYCPQPDGRLAGIRTPGRHRQGISPPQTALHGAGRKRPRSGSLTQSEPTFARPVLPPPPPYPNTPSALPCAGSYIGLHIAGYDLGRRSSPVAVPAMFPYRIFESIRTLDNEQYYCYNALSRCHFQVSAFRKHHDEFPLVALLVPFAP